MKQCKFPPGWDEDRVEQVMSHYESQTEKEAVAEDEAAFEAPDPIKEIPATTCSKGSGTPCQVQGCMIVDQ